MFIRLHIVRALLIVVLLFSCRSESRAVKPPEIDRQSELYKAVILRLYRAWRLKQDEKYYGLEPQQDPNGTIKK